MRLSGLDVARFLAFIGMVVVNFRIAAGVAHDRSLASIVTDALEGRAAALFVVLAGIAITLARPSARMMAKRGVFLLAIGLLNQIIFVADILHYYGVYFLAAILGLKLSPKGLILATIGVLILSFFALINLNYEAGWNWDTLEYTGFWTLTGFVRNLLFNGWHPVFPWLSFLLFGMFLGHLSLASPSVQTRLAIFGTLWTALIIWLSAALSQDPQLSEIIGLSPIPPGPLYVLAGIGTSTAAIGGVLLITPTMTRLGITRILAIPGRQTLTLYVGHILIGMGALELFGWLENAKLSSTEIFLFSIAFTAACALYALAWAKKFKRGPLEALMRAITG